jgi:hypothetical protein
MKNGNISALFSTRSGDEHKAVTLSLSTHAHEVASRCANALRIKKGRWLELLIENAINEYSELGGENGKGEETSENLVHDRGMESDQNNGKKTGYISAGFNSLRDHEGGE